LKKRIAGETRKKVKGKGWGEKKLHKLSGPEKKKNSLRGLRR